MKTNKTPPQKKAAPQAKSNGDHPVTDGHLEEMRGIRSTIALGQLAKTEFRAKNRIILALACLLGISMLGNVFQVSLKPEPLLLGETPDGRIRELPLVKMPIYTKKEITAWADRCVSQMYDLTYVAWREKIQNDMPCLSDSATKGFVDSLRQIGLLDVLDPQKQGIIHAVSYGAVVRRDWLSPEGYFQWYVEVPYRIKIDGRQQGSIEVVMKMLIRRVSMTWREDGLWIDNYTVSPRSAGAKL